MPDNIHNIQETLKNIIMEYGEEILQDSNGLSAILCDIAPELKKERMLLTLVLDEKIGEYYVNAGNTPKERIISRTLDSLSKSFSEDCIQDITFVLFYALGWDTTIVTVYFDEYKRRKAHTEQVHYDASPEKIQSELLDGLNENNEKAAMKADTEDDHKAVAVSDDVPMDLQEQVREFKKRISILLVIIALILLGILIFSILAWRNTRASVPDTKILQFDLNEDGFVDSTDAAVILGISAKMGVGSESGLDESLLGHADVNGDSSVDASDAACILQYAAYAGSGNADFWQNS